MGASSDTNKIDETFSNIYKKFPNKFNTKEEFELKIEQYLSKYLPTYLENINNQKYYNNKVNEFWKKIEDDRIKIKKLEEEDRRRRNIIEKLLFSHKNEIERINEENKTEKQKQEQNKQILEETINLLKEEIKKLKNES